MAKWIGDVAVTVRHTITGIEVEAETEGEAMIQMEAEAENRLQEVMDSGDWNSDVEDIECVEEDDDEEEEEDDDEEDDDDA